MPLPLIYEQSFLSFIYVNDGWGPPVRWGDRTMSGAPGQAPKFGGWAGGPDRNLVGGQIWGVPLRRVFWSGPPLGLWGAVWGVPVEML